jgi:hypothetical protein
MMSIQDERLLAPEYREEAAKEIFSEFWNGMSSEEYAARFSHRFGASSFDEYQYQDEKFDVWIQEVHVFMGAPKMLVEAREKFLTASFSRGVRS